MVRGTIRVSYHRRRRRLFLFADFFPWISVYVCFTLFCTSRFLFHSLLLLFSYHNLRFFAVPFFYFGVLFSWNSPQMIVPIVVVVHLFFCCNISHLVALTSRRLNLHIFNSFSCLECVFFCAASVDAFALLWYIRVYLVVANWTLAAERVHFHKSILNGLLRCDVTATAVWVKSQFAHIVYVRLIFYSVSCRHLPFAFFCHCLSLVVAVTVFFYFGRAVQSSESDI